MSVVVPGNETASEEALLALTSALGLALPEEYLDFVSRHDGVRPCRNSFLVGGGNESNVSRFVAVADAPALLRDVEGFPQGMIPFAEDDCGNFVYVDPRSGLVYFWDHEIEDGDQQIASDIEGFITKLTPFDESSVRLAPGQATRVWVNPSFKPEFD